MTGRDVADLAVAIVRSGKTIDNIAFLAGLSVPRLRELMAGAVPTETETTRLTAALPDWRG